VSNGIEVSLLIILYYGAECERAHAALVANLAYRTLSPLVRIITPGPEVRGELADVIVLVVGNVEEDFGRWKLRNSYPLMMHNKSHGA
jgi:hypothetical protein